MRERGFQCFVTRRGFAAFAFTRTFIVSRTDTSPFAETMLIFETAHVRAGFGENLFSAHLADTGNRVKGFDRRFVICVATVLNHRVCFFDLSRLYMLAYPELKTLATIGQGGLDTVPDEGKLLSIKPDVIFVTYLADKL